MRARLVLHRSRPTLRPTTPTPTTTHTPLREPAVSTSSDPRTGEHGIFSRRTGTVVMAVAGLLAGLNATSLAYPDWFLDSKDLLRHPMENKMRAMAAEMGISHPERIRVVVMSGFGAMTRGSTHLPNGAVIALPRTSLTDNVEEHMRQLTIEGQLADHHTAREIVEELKKYIWQTQNQTLFQAAHELAHLKHNDAMLFLALSPIPPVVSFKLVDRAWARFFKGTRGMRLFFGKMSAVGMVGLLWLSTSNLVSRLVENHADRTAAMHSLQYAMGGVEHFSRQLQRNKLLRELCASGTPDVADIWVTFTSGISSEGNNVFDLAHPLLTARLASVQHIADIIEQTKQAQGAN
eukprot:comp51733_c0_seq1/m.47680 comp51733_c0_seq1/g.47680  ORF comp51733_c0_seq1/g.47680 comp51733_c0_seq1/m.47680 type:complete len:349 (-) comp51733_c0_seq1:489-1535(-)